MQQSVGYGRKGSLFASTSAKFSNLSPVTPGTSKAGRRARGRRRTQSLGGTSHSQALTRESCTDLPVQCQSWSMAAAAGGTVMSRPGGGRGGPAAADMHMLKSPAGQSVRRCQCGLNPAQPGRIHVSLRLADLDSA